MKHFIASKIGGGLKSTWIAAHRSGLCERCEEAQLETIKTGKKDAKGKLIVIRKCPNCGHDQGKMIAVQMHRGKWFRYFFGNWDSQRVIYCENHRDDVLPKGFREGDFKISTIMFTIKLKRRGEWEYALSPMPEVREA